MRALDSVSWTIVIVLALTLGLAPFTPEPHIWEKLKMLASGELVRAVDWFDLLLHGVPWVVLGFKAVRTLRPDA
ncbi:RND transporter [Shimia thalassica]|uniref:RND transporter n=1 Tax=Shimia thalassica TaxID=1715693 RepID=UPI0026E30F40|nr:RND transporter [Shimia thalassica]MDO6479844.1 RND transporter [Shimia thalassica]